MGGISQQSQFGRKPSIFRCDGVDQKEIEAEAEGDADPKA